jgi:protoporphyrinogen/coproporphyrinogen III oxidase
MLREPAVPRRKTGEDETIHAFLSRRFGDEAAAGLGGPILAGVYAGDTHQLSIQATFPQLPELEARYGSLVRGLFATQAEEGGPSFWQWLRRAGPAHAPSPFRTLDGGLGVLTDELAARLGPEVVRPGVSATALRRERNGWRLETSAGPIDADDVVLAVPARIAAGLVPDPDAATELASVPFVSTATVFFGFDASAVERSLDGLGFVVPEGQARILAGTWVSSKWPGRAPPGKVLLRAFVGGARGEAELAEASDVEVSDLALSELRRLMGRLSEPELACVFRYPKASAQPVVGHLDRMRRVFARLSALPGLHLGGSGYDGVGIPDCVRQARAIAASIARGRG